MPELLARSQNTPMGSGSFCFYCGADCGQQFKRHTYVKDTFTATDQVARPGSEYVCPGCVIALEESATIQMADGTTKTVTKAARRMFSWLATPGQLIAASKAHRTWLRQICLSPPSPPWALSIAVSGQKQILFRGVVNHGDEPFVVTMEGERITYYVPELTAHLADAALIIAACGKPATEDLPTLGHRFALHEYHGALEGFRLAEWWNTVAASPLFRLACFLSQSKTEIDTNDRE